MLFLRYVEANSNICLEVNSNFSICFSRDFCLTQHCSTYSDLIFPSNIFQVWWKRSGVNVINFLLLIINYIFDLKTKLNSIFLTHRTEWIDKSDVSTTNRSWHSASATTKSGFRESAYRGGGSYQDIFKTKSLC